MSTQATPASGSGLCPICMSAQPATSTAPALAQAPALLIAAAPAIGAPTVVALESPFSLYIRPPPAA